MKRIFIIILALLSIQAFAGGIYKGDGMAWKSYNSHKDVRVVYHVDTETHVCSMFVWDPDGGMGIRPVDCADLAQREEWKKIISWVK